MPFFSATVAPSCRWCKISHPAWIYPFQSNIKCYCLAGLNGLHVVWPQLFWNVWKCSYYCECGWEPFAEAPSDCLAETLGVMIGEERAVELQSGWKQKLKMPWLGLSSERKARDSGAQQWSCSCPLRLWATHTNMYTQNGWVQIH